MIYGLNLLTEGFVEHGLILRSKLQNENIPDRLSAERNDLERFISEAPNIDDPNIRDMVLGVALIARGFYNTLESDDVTKGLYPANIKKVCDLIHNIDEQYYGGFQGKSDDMKLIVDWINKYERKSDNNNKQYAKK